MNKKMTIVMPFLNEDNEPIETVKSIYETTPEELFKIIAIDDCSKKETNFSGYEDVRYIRNKNRLGSGACKHNGAIMADTPYVFIIDAHLRFKKDNWMEKIIEGLEREPETAWCTTCLGLGYGAMNMDEPKGKYYGADMLFIDKNTRPGRPAREILEPKWAPKKDGVEYEIPCILGANYAFSTKWFNYIHGMEGLKMWGTEEPYLSIKTWMAGGKCKIRTDIEIGHKFRDNAPYVTEISYLIYNKIFMCKTIFPDDLGEKLISRFPKDINFKRATKMIEENKNKIAEEKEYCRSISKKTIYDYCNKFGIRLP